MILNEFYDFLKSNFISFLLELFTTERTPYFRKSKEERSRNGMERWQRREEKKKRREEKEKKKKKKERKREKFESDSICTIQNTLKI